MLCHACDVMSVSFAACDVTIDNRPCCLRCMCIVRFFVQPSEQRRKSREVKYAHESQDTGDDAEDIEIPKDTVRNDKYLLMLMLPLKKFR